jgi:hypothetical protein
MNPQPEEDWQRRLQKLEAEINSVFVEPEKSQAPGQTPESSFLNYKSYLGRLRPWFDGLPKTNKLVVAGVGVLLSFALLQTVLKLVASVVSLAILAGLVYVGYRFFVSGSFDKKQ